MRIKLSFDDGSLYDLKLMELLKKYNLPALFFLPIKSWGFENIELYKDFEVGGHTFSHPQDLKLLSDDMLEFEIVVAKELFEKETKRKLEWFCYPRGRFNQLVKDKVIKAGFKKARTTNIENGFDKFEIGGVHCYQRKEYKGVDWLEFIKKYITSNPYKLINIWGHSSEINRGKDWDKLEELFKFINENQYI